MGNFRLFKCCYEAVEYIIKEIYDHIFDTHTEYERVLEENGLENGKVNSSMQFVRNKYLELMEKSFKQ